MKKLPLLLAALLLAATACTDEESSLGLGLTDPATLYNGHTDTLEANMAYSLRDDSLVTSNFSYGIIGNYTDPMFGHVSSMLYSQIGLASGMSSINFDEVSIDSVVLTLTVDGLFPDSTADYTFHFEVMQLAEAVLSDTDYYSFDTLPVNPSARFFDGDVTVGANDSLVRLPLSLGINQVLSQSGDSAGFVSATKGLRIRLTDAGQEGMLSISFASTRTCLTAYYHYGSDTVPYYYEFLVGGGVSHFTHFSHDYSGSLTGGADSIDGSNELYLEPLAGYCALVSFDSAVHTFNSLHPTATIHHAELLLPVAVTADANHPDQLLARKNSGSQPYIADLLDLYTMAGYDGKYDASRGCYRLRVTQHVQGLLRDGNDPGILLVLNARQNDASRTILNGRTATDPVRIEIVFSE